jgi:hypothetical protein
MYYSTSRKWGIFDYINDYVLSCLGHKRLWQGFYVLVVVDKSFRPFVVVFDNSSKFLLGISSMTSDDVAVDMEDTA